MAHGILFFGGKFRKRAVAHIEKRVIPETAVAALFITYYSVTFAADGKMPAVRKNTAHRRNERCSTLFGRNVPELFKKLSVVFIVIAVLSTQLVCGLLLNTLFISILYTKAFTALLATRAIQFVVMSVVEIIFAELALDRAKLLQKVKLA